MAKNSQNKLKDILLISFVIISVALVVFQWVDGVWVKDDDVTPGFIRPTFSSFEVDDSAYEQWDQLEVTATGQMQETNIPPSTPMPTQGN